MSDEATVLRRRVDDLQSLLDRLPDPAAGPPSLLLKTVAVTSYPAAAGVVYGVQAVRPSGNEVEGATPGFTALTGVFYATNLGSKVPPVGTYVLGACVGGRWVFRYD